MAHPQTFKRAYDEYRAEAAERIETAIGVLKGDLRREERRSAPLDMPQTFQTFEVEHPARDPKNPRAAILGHISNEERRYVAACELAEYVADSPLVDEHEFVDFGRHPPLDEQLERIAHVMRGNAIEMIERRLRVEDADEYGVNIEDPVTTYRYTHIFRERDPSKSQIHDGKNAAVERCARQLLEWLENELVA